MEEKNNRPEWEGKGYSFFQNRQCEYFPCHAGVPEEEFNCLFCYCPLYALGDRCGGRFTFLPGGVKDCSNCILPHSEQGYAYVTRNYERILEAMKRLQERESDR